MLGLTNINNSENSQKVIKATKRGISDGVIEAASVVTGYTVGKKVAESTKNTTLGMGAGVVTYAGTKAGLTTARECIEIERARREVERLENEGSNDKKKKGILG